MARPEKCKECGESFTCKGLFLQSVKECADKKQWAAEIRKIRARQDWERENPFPLSMLIMPPQAQEKKGGE